MVILAIWKGYCVGFVLFMVRNLYTICFDRSNQERKAQLFEEIQLELVKIGISRNAAPVVVSVAFLVYSSLWFVYIPKLLLKRYKNRKK